MPKSLQYVRKLLSGMTNLFAKSLCETIICGTREPESFCGTLGKRCFGRLPQTTPKLNWKSPKLFKLLGPKNNNKPTPQPPQKTWKTSKHYQEKQKPTKKTSNMLNTSVIIIYTLYINKTHPKEKKRHPLPAARPCQRPPRCGARTTRGCEDRRPVGWWTQKEGSLQ